MRVLARPSLPPSSRRGSRPPRPWVEVKSGHFTVITNAGEKAGRRTAWQFEQIRAGLALLWPWAKIEAGPPFFVFAVRDLQMADTDEEKKQVQGFPDFAAKRPSARRRPGRPPRWRGSR